MKIKNILSDIYYCLAISWRTSKFYTAARLVFQVAASLLPLLSVYITSLILNVLTPGVPDALALFVMLTVFFLVVQLADHWCTKLNQYLQQIHDEMITNYLERKGIEKASRVDLRFFDAPAYYNKLQLMNINSGSISQIVWNIVDLISNTISFIAAFMIMFQYSPLYSCIIVLAYIPIAIYDQVYTKKLYNWQVENVGEERKLNYISQLVMKKEHAKNIRIFGIAEHLFGMYVNIWKAWFSKRKSIIKKWSMISLALSAIPQILTVLVLLEVGANIIAGKNEIGDFALYSGMISQMIMTVFMITFSIMRISENKLRIRDFREFFSWTNAVEGTGEIELKQIDTVEFANVSFTYPGNEQPTIKNLNLKFTAKERLALVGINGAGKTTLVKLLLRFYDVTEGSLLINGANIKTFTLTSLRKCFSVMFQEYPNYAFTLRENIRMSDMARNYTDADILEACEKSGADQVIEDWENGLDTYLYREFVEDGRELSGGENQKIALARTFFHNGDLVVLDEPSSSIDPEAEYELFKKMVDLCKDKGVLLITHRLSNVVLADRIIVIENGILMEDGSHKELMDHNGRYATLFQYQAENYVNQKGGSDGN